MFKRRQKRVKVTPQEPIDIESYKPTSKVQVVQLWIPELGLKQSEREILLSHTAWLNDDLINAAQKLLRKANPVVPGLQDVVSGLTMNFDVEPGEFVQILHTGQGHWNTISTIGMRHAEVQVFDSMYMSVPTMATAQIASLLATEEPAIQLNIMDVQMQSGDSNCGLFSIAFATALVFGEQPGALLFNQQKMRAHLIKCHECQEISMFPTLR